MKKYVDLSREYNRFINIKNRDHRHLLLTLTEYIIDRDKNIAEKTPQGSESALYYLGLLYDAGEKMLSSLGKEEREALRKTHVDLFMEWQHFILNINPPGCEEIF